MKYVFRLLLGKCPHTNYGWPRLRKDVDGTERDMQTCTACGHERIAPLQLRVNRAAA